MNGMLLAYGGQWGLGAWAWLFVPLIGYAFIVVGLFLATPAAPGMKNYFFGQIGESLRRATGFPGWAMAGVLSGLWSLLVLVIGFYWDVAWHIDNGRDTNVFTVPHVMILVGLGGLMYAAGIAILFATLEDAEVGVHLGIFRIPWSAIVLFFLGLGATAAFPLDNMWHKAYGIDVTLWSPTHLQLIAGGSLGTIGMVLMCVEALPKARPNWLGKGIYALSIGTVLVGVSTFQGEFDNGVPQFQVLFFPLLIAAAAAFALVMARLGLGPWGAVKATVSYLILRGFLAVVVAGPLHHSVPRFPLYLPTALCVEAAAFLVGERDRLRFALVAGALGGTVGLFCELVFAGVTGGSAVAVSPALALKILILGPVVAIAAAVIGAGFARVFSRHDDRMPVAALAIAGLALLVAFAYPLPRRAGNVSATIRLEPAGSQAVVDVTLSPPNAAQHADAFNVFSWQGGGRIAASLDRVGPGEYRSSRPVPIAGRWKTTVNLLRGDQMMAAPVYFPADPEISAVAIPAQAVRTTPFVLNTKLLLREQHSGPAYVATLAYLGVATSVLIWVALMALTVSRLGSRGPLGEPSVQAGDDQRPILSRRLWERPLSTAVEPSRHSAGAASQLWGRPVSGSPPGAKPPGSGSPPSSQPREPVAAQDRPSWAAPSWDETPWRDAVHAGTSLSQGRDSH